MCSHSTTPPTRSTARRSPQRYCWSPTSTSSTPSPSRRAARAHLNAMVDGSSTDADWVLAQVGAAEVTTLANRAGMTSFHLDTTDPSNTRVDALDLARFFAQINTLIPATHRKYGMSLLASNSSAESWGILKAGITGITASIGGRSLGTANLDCQPGSTDRLRRADPRAGDHHRRRRARSRPASEWFRTSPAPR